MKIKDNYPGRLDLIYTAMAKLETMKLTKHESGVNQDDSVYAEEIFMTKITELGLTIRVRNTFEAAKISTIGQLVNKTDAQLLCLCRFGITSLTQVKTALCKYGLIHRVMVQSGKGLMYYLNGFKGRCSLVQLSDETSMIKRIISKVIRINKIEYMLYNPVPDIVVYVRGNPINTLTIKDVANKVNHSYSQCSLMLRHCGYLSDIKKVYRHGVLVDEELESMLKEMTVNQISIIRRKGESLGTKSRQGIYNYCSRHGIDTLTRDQVKKIKR